MSAEPRREERDRLRSRLRLYIDAPDIDDDDRWIASSVIALLDDLRVAERRAEIVEKALERIAESDVRRAEAIVLSRWAASALDEIRALLKSAPE